MAIIFAAALLWYLSAVQDAVTKAKKRIEY